MDLRQLIAMAVINPGLKQALIKDFAGTCQTHGVALTNDQKNRLSKVDDATWNKIESDMSTQIETSPCTL